MLKNAIGLCTGHTRDTADYVGKDEEYFLVCSPCIVMTSS